MSTSRRLLPFALVVASSAAAAQEQVWTRQGQLHGERFGASMALLPDCDGDGVRDLLVGAPNATALGDYATARVLSGATLATLLEVRGGGARNFGGAVADGGDVDGDGTTDLLVGDKTAGEAHLFSGRDGALLRKWVGRGPGFNDGFGAGLAGMGDLDGDGFGDVAIGAPLEQVGGVQLGTVQLYSGQSGARLHRFEGSLPGSGFFGAHHAFADVGDVDRDGVADLGLIDQGPAPVAIAYLVRVVSGATGVERFRVAFDAGDRADARLASIAAAGDWDGDGRGDVLVGGSFPFGSDPARAFVLSGDDGHELLAADSPERGDVQQVDTVGDRDGDGKAEFVLSVEYAGAGGKWSAVTLHRGSDGALLGRIDGFVGAPFGGGGAFGRALVGGIDVDGDGLGDVTISDAEVSEESLKVGAVEHHAWPGGSLVLRRLGVGEEQLLTEALALLDDHDGDGAADFVAANVSSIDRVRDSLRLRSGRDGTSLADLRVVGRPDGDLVAVPDLDGDGHDDLAIGVETTSSAPRVELRSSADGALLGTFLGTGGKDGFGERIAVGVQPGGALQLAIAAPRSGSIDSGAVAVFDVASGALLFQRNGSWTDELLGSSCAWLGDVNGDAIGDWAFGGPGYGSGAKGRVLVVSGSAGATITTLGSAVAGDRFGHRVAVLRDLDGDGMQELAVAAPGAGSGDEGEVKLFAGGSWLVLATVAGAAAGDQLGSELVALRDVDGDGLDEWAALALEPDRFDVRAGATARLMMRFPFYGYGGVQRLATATPWQAGSPSGDALPDLVAHDPTAPIGQGSAWLLALDDLMLQIDPPHADVGATVTAWLRGGQPGRPGLFVLIAVDGVPTDAWLGLALFDAQGEQALSDVVPPGLSGMSWTLQGFGIGVAGGVRDTTPQTLTFE